MKLITDQAELEEDKYYFIRYNAKNGNGDKLPFKNIGKAVKTTGGELTVSGVSRPIKDSHYYDRTIEKLGFNGILEAYGPIEMPTDV